MAGVLIKMHKSRKAFIMAMAVACVFFQMGRLEASPREEASPKMTCYNGVCFPSFSEVDGQKMPLSGAERKRWLGFHLYDAGLYMGKDVHPNQYLESRPKKLVLRYRRIITVEQMAAAAHHSLVRNPEVNMPAIKDRLDLLHSLFRPVRRGDEYALVNYPGIGTELLLNGFAQGMIPGDDFAKAYFSIWIARSGLKV